MSVLTLEGVVVNGQIRLTKDVNLPESATVYVVIPNGDSPPSEPKFVLEDMIARMPSDYSATEEGFGLPVGKEEW